MERDSMKHVRAIALLAGAALAASSFAYADAKGRKFEWNTKSPEARKLLLELQGRIENFQFGPQNAELAKKIMAADPNWAMGQYYVSATGANPADAEKDYLKAKEMAANASDGERKFIEAMYWARVNQGNDFKQAIGPRSARAEAFLAGDELLKGNYEKARGLYEGVEKNLPKGSVPFAIRFGVTFSH